MTLMEMALLEEETWLLANYLTLNTKAHCPKSKERQLLKQSKTTVLSTILCGELSNPGVSQQTEFSKRGGWSSRMKISQCSSRLTQNIH